MPNADAVARRSWTTNARHENIHLTVVQLALLPHLDGTNDIDALIELLRAKVAEGQIVFQNAGETITEDEAIQRATADHLAAALTTLSQSAILIAA